MNNIRKFREKQGHTQQQLADLVGVDRSQICRYENGEQRPSADMLNKLAYNLRVDADPQGSMTASLGFAEQDDIGRTLATIMEDLIDEVRVLVGFGFLPAIGISPFIKNGMKKGPPKRSS